MVQVRRSRRIQSQSDDEASVASSAHSGSTRVGQSLSKVTTPMRTIIPRATKGGGKSAVATKEKELGAIPETIAAATADGDAATSKTPAKSKSKTRIVNSPPGDVVSKTVGLVGAVEQTTKKAKTLTKSEDRRKKKAVPGGDETEQKGAEDTTKKENVVVHTPAEGATKEKGKSRSKSTGSKVVPAVSTPKSKDTVTSTSVDALKSTPKELSNRSELIKAECDTHDGLKLAKSDKKRKKKDKKEDNSTEQDEIVNSKKDAVLPSSTENSTKKKRKGRNISTVSEEGPDASSNKASTPKSENTSSPNPVPPKVTSKVAETQNGTAYSSSAKDKSLKMSKNKFRKMRKSLLNARLVAAAPTAPEEGMKSYDTKPTKSASSEKTKCRSVPMDNLNSDSLHNVSSPKIEGKSTIIKKKKSSTRKNKKNHKKECSSKHAKPAVRPSPSIELKDNLSSQDESLFAAPSESSFKPKLILDVKVHRLRFLKLHPKSILSMASTSSIHFSNLNEHTQRHPSRLAVSREGGSVELLSPQDRWVSIGYIPGVRGRDVDAMVWIYGVHGKDVDVTHDVSTKRRSRISYVDEQLRLFGCSRDGTIFELDFATKRQTNVIGSGGGGVFCLVSMCFREKSQIGSVRNYGGYFAAGCEDGTIKIYDAFGLNGGGLASGIPTLAATLPSAGNAILSMVWLPGQSGNVDGGMGGSVIFAAVADGTIRRFDCVTSIGTGPISTGTIIAPSSGSVSSVSYRWKSTLRMTVENRGLRQSTKVWALEALSDGTVISGDSLGNVQIWDGMSGTMTQTFDHNESGADVLCLAVSEDETKIFASGIDSSVRCIQRQSSISTEDGIRKWISSNSHRKHSHDVKALAICHKDTHNSSNPLELLVSGSVDTRLCSYVVRDFKNCRPRIWYNWPSLSPISVSRKQRLLGVTRDTRIDLYRLNDHTMADSINIMLPEARDESKSFVKTIAIQSPFNLSCSIISDDGKFLAASDAASLYIFSLVVEDDGGILDVCPTKISLSGDCKHPATALKFIKDHLICATNNGPINVLKISVDTVSLMHVFKEHTIDWSATSHHFPIVSLDVSADGKWLAAGRFSSEMGSVHVFKLPTSDDYVSYQHWWAVPQMDAPTTCIKFLGGESVASSLAVGCSNNEFYIYNLDRRSLSHWSNDMGVPLLKKMPKELTSRSEPVTRIVSNSVAPQRFILGSHGYFCVVDLEQPVPDRSTMFPPDHLRAKRFKLIKEDDALILCPHTKKKTDNETNNTNFTICLRYSDILFQDFIAENEMVIAEEPWISILEDLPDALARRVYGT